MAYLLVLSIYWLTLVFSASSTVWLQPTALSAQKSLDSCLKLSEEVSSEELQDLQRPELSDNAAVHAILRCIMLDLGLWSDVEGLQAKRIAKLLAKHKMTTELVVVIDYCNASHRNFEDTNRWAFEAYRCATSGRIGDWVRDYVKSLLSEKGSQKASTFLYSGKD